MNEIFCIRKKKIWIRGMTLLLLLSIMIGTLLLSENQKSYADTVSDAATLSTFLTTNHLTQVQQDFGSILNQKDTSATGYSTLLGSTTIVDHLFATNGHNYWAAVAPVEKEFQGLSTEFTDLTSSQAAQTAYTNIKKLSTSEQATHAIHNTFDTTIDHMFTAVLEKQPSSSQPRVDPGNTKQNVTYNGGKVLDGKTNIYAIFWEGDSSQQPTPTYISLVTRFLGDIGTSPMYADLSQYTDANGHAPTSAVLAGTYTDTTPFPTAMKADLAMSPQPDLGGFYHQEIISVATQKGWNDQNYHNLFVLFPIANNGCGAHGYLGDRAGERLGSPVAYASYPYVNGQNTCVVSAASPNKDHTADIAIGEAAHEIMEAAADPYPGQSWGEIADPCNLPAATIDPITQANVVWNGHSYLIQEVWDNYRNGCVLEGP